MNPAIPFTNHAVAAFILVTSVAAPQEPPFAVGTAAAARGAAAYAELNVPAGSDAWQGATLANIAPVLDTVPAYKKP